VQVNANNFASLTGSSKNTNNNNFTSFSNAVYSVSPFKARHLAGFTNPEISKRDLDGDNEDKDKEENNDIPKNNNNIKSSPNSPSIRNKSNRTLEIALKKMNSSSRKSDAILSSRKSEHNSSIC